MPAYFFFREFLSSNIWDYTPDNSTPVSGSQLETVLHRQDKNNPVAQIWTCAKSSGAYALLTLLPWCSLANRSDIREKRLIFQLDSGPKNQLFIGEHTTIALSHLQGLSISETKEPKWTNPINSSSLDSELIQMVLHWRPPGAIINCTVV